MTTRITQVDGQTEKLTTLRVEGSPRLEDAELLESTYLELRAKHQGRIAIDLAGTSFLDSDSASGSRFASNPGLKLANAFGVFSN